MLLASDAFLFDSLLSYFSFKNSQPPSSRFPSVHFHFGSNLKDVSCLHWEHWSVITSAAGFAFHDLVLSWLQSFPGHCLLTVNPKGREPGCVHLKVVVTSGWYWMISVWAPRVWWSVRNVTMLRRSYTKWDTAQSITNLLVDDGWKFGCENARTFSKSPLGASTLEGCRHSTRSDTHRSTKSFTWSWDSLWLESPPHERRLRIFFLLLPKMVRNLSVNIVSNI